MAAEKETAAPWLMPYPTSNGEVKLGATNMQEISERATKLFKERLLTLAEHGGSFTAASGELVKATGGITVTLPAAAANATVGVLANNHEVKIGAGAALIYGDFITGITPITLVGYQHVILQSDGTNWFIIAGESKREVTYEAIVGRTAETEYEPSPTRPAYVALEGTGLANVRVGGVKIISSASAAEKSSFSFICPAGQKWQATGVSLKSSYLLL